MDFEFTEDQNLLRETVKKFTEKELKPLAMQIDKEGKIPRGLILKLGQMGLLGVPFPEEYGGIGAGEMGYAIALEELSHGSGSVVTMIGAHTSIGAMAIYLSGSDEQKKKYLTPLAMGERLAAFALTEPNAGSDAAAIQTFARRDGDFYILNGNKVWITNGDIADIIVVFAVTDKSLGANGGITAFIVEANTPGFRVGHIEDKMGIRGSSTAELFFEDMRVPGENVLGEEGMGFLTAMRTLEIGRLGLAAGCLGAAKEALAMSIAHAKGRVQFGSSLSDKQAIQWMLADMTKDIFAMESMVYRTAWACDKGMKISRESAICKLFCSEALDEIVDKALQIHGGMGYMQDYPIEMMYRDSRINRIFEGTNEVQRMLVAASVIRKGRY